jgi:flagellar hook-basal body protein
MGLASSLSTALTGLSAAETTIDVVGNNLANSSTVGFKASTAEFATQFLQTQSLGSAPAGNNAGTNPRQIGLGTMVSGIVPNFNQGTIQISSNPTDMAIQGDGFFIVQGSAGGQDYTRNGLFKLNSDNELVTSTGNRLLGFGVNSQFQIDTTQLQPLKIPLGSSTVAKATENVVMQGTLTPTGDIADQAQVIQTSILTDGSKSWPDGTGLWTGDTKSKADVSQTVLAPGMQGSYKYVVVFSNGVNTTSRPSPVSSSLDVGSGATAHAIDLSNIPTPPSGDILFTERWIYRTVNEPAGDTNYYLVKKLTDTTTTSWQDTTPDADIINAAKVLNPYGPGITGDTKLADVLRYDGTQFQQVFTDIGTLQFSGRKGGRTLATKEIPITPLTTVKDLATFMEDSLGIQPSPGDDQNYPIPNDSGTGWPAGFRITQQGNLVFVGNNGVDNAVDIGLSGLQITTNDVPPQQVSVDLPFTVTQQAKGQSAVADMIVYDSLGHPPFRAGNRRARSADKHVHRVPLVRGRGGKRSGNRRENRSGRRRHQVRRQRQFHYCQQQHGEDRPSPRAFGQTAPVQSGFHPAFRACRVEADLGGVQARWVGPRSPHQLHRG